MRSDGLKRGEGGIRERLRADGSLSFQARWWDVVPGHEPVLRSKTFLSRDEAEDHLRTVLRTKRDDRYRSPSAMTVSDLVSEYIDRASSRITERTKMTYTRRAASMIDPTIGKRKLDSVTPLDIQRWIDSLSRTGFKPSTIHAAVAVLMGALREAALLGITDRHLGTGIRRPSIRHTERTTWTEAEVKAVLRAVRGDLRFDALYHVAIATGMRPGELRALQWADVDLGAGMIRVRRTITRGTDRSELSVIRTKTGTGRAVALSPSIVERLRWHKVRQKERQLAHEHWQKLDLVFDRGDGHWIYASHWQRYQIEMCERAGVPVIRLHDIRHTSASLELAAGTHPKIVAERLGHANIQITLDLYSHVSPDLQRHAAQALSDRLFDDEPEIADKAWP